MGKSAAFSKLLDFIIQCSAVQCLRPLKRTMANSEDSSTLDEKDLGAKATVVEVVELAHSPSPDCVVRTRFY